MRPTTVRLSKGFFSRSLDEFKRQAAFAFSAEGIKGPSGPLPLFDFHNADSIKDCKAMCDESIGGFSKVSLVWVPGSSSSPSSPSPSSTPQTNTPPPVVQPSSLQQKGHARFHGTISTALPQNNPTIRRSGFAAFRTHDRPPTLFGRALYNIDMYTYLALRIRSDGRSYLVNIQTESVVPEDLHQHRLFAKRPGEWETVLIKWNDFVRTNHGSVVEPQTEMLRQKVRTLGIGLTDRVPGPFELCIERIWATNDINETGEGVGVDPQEEGLLRNKQGKHINWK
ncbi:CIA30-domain-containing protein [Xylariaceae sp. FL0255]|nr:CIA30-domain-containing protein [Xylariaceae sp. FL0255]